MTTETWGIPELAKAMGITSKNYNVPEMVLHQLRWAKFSPKDFDRLVENIVDIECTREVARNWNLPQATVRKLYALNDNGVNMALAKNSQTPSDVVADLWKTADKKLKVVLIEHPRLPLEDFREVFDTSPFTKKLATIVAHRWREDKTSVSDYMLEAVANSDYKSAINTMFSWRYALPANVLGILVNRAEHLSKDAQAALSHADGLTAQQIDRLYKDISPINREVLNAIAERDDTPLYIQEDIVTKHKTASLRINIARRTKDMGLLSRIYEGTKSKDIRLSVESNPNWVGPKTPKTVIL